jgi:starvation-inducible outer membrane lipoprotein
MTIVEAHLMQGRVVANGFVFWWDPWCNYLMVYGTMVGDIHLYIHQIDYSYLRQPLGRVKVFQFRVL